MSVYIAATLCAEHATVISSHREGHRARRALEGAARRGVMAAAFVVLSVDMSQPGSERPKPGDVLATKRAAVSAPGNDLVAIANVRVRRIP